MCDSERSFGREARIVAAVTEGLYVKRNAAGRKDAGAAGDDDLR